MKFITTRETLLEPLSRIHGVTEDRRTLPLLSNTLLAVEEGGTLSMTGTDMEMELVFNLKLMEGESGETTVSARKFYDICRTLPVGAQISFAQESGRAIIRSASSRFVLGTLPADEYPQSGILTEEIKVFAKQGSIRELIELTQFAIANQDVRYWLNGLLLEISKESVRAVSTDGHRLAWAELNLDTDMDGVDGDLLRIIVPRKGIVELARMLSTMEDDVELCIGNNVLQTVFSNVRFTTKLIDGQYPDYSSVLPKPSQCGKEVLLEKEELKQILIRSAILCGEGYRSVRMSFDKNLLRASTLNMEREEAEDEIPIEYTGEPLEARFNVNYLLEAIGSVPTKKVYMCFNDLNGSCLIMPDGREDCRYVVMPMKL